MQEPRLVEVMRKGASARAVWAIGLMSGTSLDGIDAALVRTDGEIVYELGPWRTTSYTPELRERLRASLGGHGDEELSRAVTDAHGAAVTALIEVSSIARSDVRIVGFHGHTLLHRPARRVTVQVGDGAALAEMLEIDVVGDFRSDDIAAGGQGAPLAPVYHAALAAGLARPLAILNVGGVANVTWMGADDTLVAFDTGPGNALIDDWARCHLGEPMDRGGRLAATGAVDESVLRRALGRSYFSRTPPKSLDRNDFSMKLVSNLSSEDGAATLTALSAAAVAAARPHLPSPVHSWLVTGGGRHNPTLMAGLRARLGAPVAAVEALGWRGDALEAEAFGFLAVRTLRGLPLSFPGTTGVASPCRGGRLFSVSAQAVD